MIHRYSLSLLVVLFLLAACATSGENTAIPSGTRLPTTTTAEAESTAAPTEASVEATEAIPDTASTDDVTATTETAAEPTAAPEATTEAAEPTAEATVEPQATEVTAEPTEAPAAPTEAAPETTGSGDPSVVTLELQPLYSGFTLPVGIVSANDGSGRLFIVEKPGTVRIVQDGQTLPDAFLDISNQVSDSSEQGLLGLAFDPNNPERFYINYTDSNGDTNIVRYSTLADNSNAADSASAELLIKLDDPAPNHNGGNLLFGPDGYLWIGMGDGGGAGDTYGNGQRYSSLFGSMMRIDVAPETGYAIPSDNPFADGGDGLQEIWAKGLRNPWRYSFDRQTGDLWIADVGQNIWEEVNHVSSTEANLNYGWPQMEATHCFTNNCQTEGFVTPVTEYSHDFGCSITGGYVYRGQASPSLQGIYLFADYCTGIYWGIPADTTSFIEPTQLLDSGVQPLAFGEDESGELYVGGVDGTIYQVVAP